MDEDWRILSQPVWRVYRDWCAETMRQGTARVNIGYQDGREEMALEIVHAIRIYRHIAGTSLLALSKEEIATALMQVLKRTGFDELAEGVYDELVDYEREHMNISGFVEAHASDASAGGMIDPTTPPAGGTRG